ncbi:MAG: hypothetical protein ACRC5H_05880 [Treponemataceae bacterium]
MKIISQKNLATLFFIYACSLLLFYYVGFASDYSDEDSASELLLAKELATENKFMSTNWNYSTEIRILNTQVVSMLLFKLTDNWKIVKIFTSVILCILLCFSYHFLFKRLHIQNKAIFFFTASLLLLPFSKIIFDYVQGNNYYIPHIIFSYIYLGLFFILCDFKQKNYTLILYFITYLFVSFFAGLAGLRYLVVFQIPLFLASLLVIPFDKNDLEKDFLSIIKKIYSQTIFKYSTIGLLFGGIGYIINEKVLNKLFSFADFNKTSFIQIGSQSFGKIIDAFFQMLGYRYENVSLFSPIAVLNLIAISFTGASLFMLYRLFRIKKSLSLYENIIIYTASISFFVITITFLLTNLSITHRYFIPSFYLFLPTIAIFFKYENKKLFKEILLIIIVTSFTLGSASVFLWVQHRETETQLKREVVQFLQANNYTLGYTSAKANIFTELSNGSIEGIILYSRNSQGNISKDELFYFRNSGLTHKRIYQAHYKDNEKVFLLLFKQDFADLKENPVIQAGELIFENEDYSVLSYQSNRFFKDTVINFLLETGGDAEQWTHPDPLK